MLVVHCSNYLGQREAEWRTVAAEWRGAAQPARGFWQRLLMWLSGAGARQAWKHESMARQADAEADMWARGRDGEDALAESLAEYLDDWWLLLRNYTPSGPWRKGGDIDGVLLGPRGVFVFESKAWKGQYRVSGDCWEWRANPYMDWEPALGNPSRQVIENASRIRKLLASNGLGGVSVQGAVAVTDPDMWVEIEPPLASYIFFAERGRRSLDPLLLRAKGSLSPTMLHRVYDTLLRSMARS